MLKQHGLHPQGGTPDSPAQPSRKGPAAPKAPKKRKAEDMIGIVKQNEDEDRPLPPMKRPRNDFQREAKQEPSQPNYPPYLFHPMVTAQGPYMPRPLPTNLYPGMPYGLTPQMQQVPQQMSHRPQPSHAMFPGMHSNHPFIMPLHQQLQTFHINQNTIPAGQESNNLGALDDINNYDFGNGYEALFPGDDPSETLAQNGTLQPETLPMVQQPQQTPADPQTEPQNQIKPEPHRSSPPLVQDLGTSDQVLVAPPQGENNGLLAPAVPSTNDLNVSAASDMLKEAEKGATEVEENALLKQENDGSCIFVAD